MEKRKSPRVVTSKKEIRYRTSSWAVHEFSVWSGEAVCRAGVVWLRDSLLVWVGAPGAHPELGGAALALPEDGRRALATSLTGVEGGNEVALSRRLAAALARPVLVWCGATFDRFTLPLVERGLVAEIKSRPDVFDPPPHGGDRIKS